MFSEKRKDAKSYAMGGLLKGCLKPIFVISQVAIDRITDIKCVAGTIIDGLNTAMLKQDENLKDVKASAQLMKMATP